MAGSKWMVDAKGLGEGSGKSIKEVLKDLDFERFLESQGSLAAAVQHFANASGYLISDRGGGGGSWHIGVPFDDLDNAVKYIELMTTRFSKAIGAEILRFELKTWSASGWGGVVKVCPPFSQGEPATPVAEDTRPSVEQLGILTATLYARADADEVPRRHAELSTQYLLMSHGTHKAALLRLIEDSLQLVKNGPDDWLMEK